MREINLNEMIDIDTLQVIQDHFSEATGLSAITVDFNGEPLTEYSNFTPFCQLMRRNEKFRKRCLECDAHGGFEAARKDQPHIYHCHAGLIDFAIPIKVRGQFIGSVLAGQVKPGQEESLQVPSISTQKSEWESDKQLSDAYNQLQEIPYKKIEASADLMYSIVNNMVEKDIVNFVQNELNEKNTKLIEQMKNHVELKRMMKDKELKALQTQINVVFLSNMLNTISRLAIVERAERTRDEVFKLEEYLTYMTKNRNKLVTLEEEMCHIELYLQLQMLRFGDKFHYELDIPDSIQHEQLPALMLNAVVDNAVTHGLEPKKADGLLYIHARVINHDLLLKITDNGLGIPQQILREFHENKNKSSLVERTTGIDLYTIDRLLKNHYGVNYVFDIESELNKGTIVTIQVPCQPGGDLND